MSVGLDQIDIPAPGMSVGADIYRQYRLSEITREEYMTFNAAMVAGLAHEDRPKLYAPMPGLAKAYVDGRLFGNQQYEQARGRVLGKWRYDTFQALDHNLYLISHFNWALEKCEAVKLASESAKLREAISRFEVLKFPHDAYKRACDVIKMDSDTKRRSE